jgi:hypothetical protein
MACRDRLEAPIFRFSLTLIGSIFSCNTHQIFCLRSSAKRKTYSAEIWKTSLVLRLTTLIKRGELPVRLRYQRCSLSSFFPSRVSGCQASSAVPEGGRKWRASIFVLSVAVAPKHTQTVQETGRSISRECDRSEVCYSSCQEPCQINAAPSTQM